MRNIVILISGRGSNMQAIIETARNEKWSAQISAVISNRPEAPGLTFAQAEGIPTVVVPNAAYSAREEFDRALQEAIDRFSPDLLVLAGFMRILTPDFVAHYAVRMLNIHPSLLPLFPGLRTHRQALEAGVKVHGATVHFVTNALDQGPAILQAEVPVLPGDTEESLAQRVLEQEHVIYPRAIRWFIEGKLASVARQVAATSA